MDGLNSFITVEPYSRQTTPNPVVEVPSGSRQGGPRTFSGMTEKEKIKSVCFDFNKQAGCGRGSCKFKHLCSFVDRAKPGWVCLDAGHNRVNHK